MLDIEVTTAPTTDAEFDVLSVDALRRHMRVASSSANVLADCEDAIKDTVASLGGRSGVLNLTILPTTYALYLPAFPNGVIDLPYPPVRSITSIVYKDSAGTEQTLSSSAYTLRRGSIEAEIFKRSDVDWPSTDPDDPRAVKITFAAGYLAADVPDNLKRLVKLIAAAWYENREAEFIGGSGNASVPQKIIFGFDFLVTQLRRPLPFGEG
ncbi:hypothetical protein [Pleomorphomonas sp. PLEO]|uniref:head-tail connector protein n=1 Tax=Pleomorphomonas sp. PLEO TaxID=3239306 RepID=UPI00351EA561